MKNLGKVLDYQKKSAEAVEKMMDLLANYYSIEYCHRGCKSNESDCNVYL